MNLTSIASLTKKILLPIIVILIIILLVSLIVFQYRTSKEKATLPKSPIEELSLLNSPLVEKPQTMSASDSLLKSTTKPSPIPVYRSAEQTLSEQEAVRIAEKFGLFDKPEIIEDATFGKVFRWNTPAAILSLDRFKLTYKKHSPASISQTIPLEDIEGLKQYTITFLQQIDLAIVPFEASIENAIFTKKLAVGQTRVNSISEADTVSVLLAFKLNSYPLVDHNGDLTPASLTVTRDKEIISLSYRFLPTLQPLEKYPIKTIAEAASEAIQNQGSVNFTPETTPQEENIETVKITSASLTSTVIAYYWPLPPLETLQPIYVFGGNAQTANGESGKISILLPAIEKEFLTQP